MAQPANGYPSSGDSIIADDTNPYLYSNRAMARLRLGLYDSAIADCQACLKLSSNNMKAYYVLSQCQLAIRDTDTALENALRAHRLCVETNDKSLGRVTAQVLSCKKYRWEERERRRARDGQELEADVVALMQRERDDMVNSCHTDLDRSQVQEEWDGKIALLRSTFERARADADRRREVPDWAIDDISFGIMVDPVVVSSRELLINYAFLVFMFICLRLCHCGRG